MYTFEVVTDDLENAEFLALMVKGVAKTNHIELIDPICISGPESPSEIDEYNSASFEEELEAGIHR